MSQIERNSRPLPVRGGGVITLTEYARVGPSVNINVFGAWSEPAPGLDHKPFFCHTGSLLVFNAEQGRWHHLSDLEDAVSANRHATDTYTGIQPSPGFRQRMVRAAGSLEAICAQFDAGLTRGHSEVRRIVSELEGSRNERQKAARACLKLALEGETRALRRALQEIGKRQENMRDITNALQARHAHLMDCREANDQRIQDLLTRVAGVLEEPLLRTEDRVPPSPEQMHTYRKVVDHLRETSRMVRTWIMPRPYAKHRARSLVHLESAIQHLQVLDYSKARADLERIMHGMDHLELRHMVERVREMLKATMADTGMAIYWIAQLISMSIALDMEDAPELMRPVLPQVIGDLSTLLIEAEQAQLEPSAIRTRLKDVRNLL